MFALAVWGVLIIALLAMIAPGTITGIFVLLGLCLLGAYFLEEYRIKRDLADLEKFYQDNADELRAARADYIDACRNDLYQTNIRRKEEERRALWKRRNPYRQHL